MQFLNYNLRPTDNSDISQIKAVIFPVLREYGLQPEVDGKDRDLNDIEKNYFINNGFFGVAVDTVSGKIIGTFGLYPVSRQICELRKMYLVKEARGKGLGKFILKKCIEIAREKQYKEIVLETISPLKEAIALYKSFGFVETKPLEINDRVDQAFKLNLRAQQPCSPA